MDDLVAELIAYAVLVSAQPGYGPPLTHPRYGETPVVERASSDRLFTVAHGRMADGYDAVIVHGLYLGGGRALLSSDLDLSEPGGASVLLHELVHFLQDVTALDFRCSGDRERQAYLIQEDWLATAHGATLHEVLDVHPLSVLAETICAEPGPFKLVTPDEPDY